MDTTQIYNLIRSVLIKAMKRTKRESEKFPGSSHPPTLMWPQMLRKHSLQSLTNTFLRTKGYAKSSIQTQ